MHIIELIYISMTSLSVFTSLPQMKQLLTLKRSDEFNLFTWVCWFMAQVSGLVYSIYIHSLPYLIVNAMWIIFYVLMIALIIRYRKVKIETPIEFTAVKE